MRRKRDIKPVHPGKLLLEEFMKPCAITQYRLAKETRLAPIQISHIIRGKRSITAETAMRLARYFNMSAAFWLNAQAHYDLLITEEKLEKKIFREVVPMQDFASVTA